MYRPRTELLIAFGGWLIGSTVSAVIAMSVVSAAGWDLAAIADIGADVGRTSLQVASGAMATDPVVPLWATAVFQIPLWAAMIGAPLVVAGGWRAAVDRYRGSFTLPDVAIGLGAGVGTQLLLVPALYWVLFSLLGDADVGGPARELAARASGAAGPLLFVVIVVVMAPFAEELFYRGLVQGTLERMMGFVPALLVAALIFAAVHFQLVQFPGLFLFGLVLGGLYRWRDGLGAPIVAHAAFNATTAVTLLAS